MFGAFTRATKGKNMDITYLDAFLAFLGITCTLASAFPHLVLQQVRAARMDDGGRRQSNTRRRHLAPENNCT